MITSQQSADVALARWQALRAAGMTPEERLASLVSDFFQVPLDLDVRYQDQTNAVAKEMADV